MFHYLTFKPLAPAYGDQCKNFKNNSKKKENFNILLSRKEKRTKPKKKKMYYAKVVFKSEYDFNANVFVISSTDLHVKVTIISS